MLLAPSSLRHLACADIISLNAIARPVLRLSQPLVLPACCRTVAKVLSVALFVRGPIRLRQGGPEHTVFP
jgi:hypothetical protein